MVLQRKKKHTTIAWTLVWLAHFSFYFYILVPPGKIYHEVAAYVLRAHGVDIRADRGGVVHVCKVHVLQPREVGVAQRGPCTDAVRGVEPEHAEGGRMGTQVPWSTCVGGSIRGRSHHQQRFTNGAAWLYCIVYCMHRAAGDSPSHGPRRHNITAAMITRRSKSSVVSHTLDKPVHVQVCYCDELNGTWTVTAAITAVQVYGSASWTLEKVLEELEMIRRARLPIGAEVRLSNPVMRALGSVVTKEGNTLNPVSNGIGLTLEPIDPPIPMIVLTNRY